MYKMKKVFSFFAMIALVGMMVACGGDTVSKDGKTTKNEIKADDSKALQMVKMSDQMVNIMEQEPSAEGYEAMMKLTSEMMKMDVSGITQEEINKVAAEFDSKYADEKALQEKMATYQEKWTKWATENEEEAKKITEKYINFDNIE